MNTIRKMLVLLVFCLMSFHALAGPSRPIANLMNTPASAFDVFLFRIQESGECYQSHWGNPGGKKLDLCLTQLLYFFDDNIIEMTFYVSEHHEMMQGISGKSQREIKDAVRSILTKVGQTAGVEKFPVFDNYFGWIQRVPIRHSWSRKDLNENEIREEVRKRTRVVLYTGPIDGTKYKAVRSHHGEITIAPVPAR
jgi:hypothetical protein